LRNVAPRAIAVSKVLEDVMKNDRGKLLTGLISRLGDFQTAEDALQEALISALGHWGRAGIPAAPHSWLMKAAYNKGIDRVRKNAREIRKVSEYGDLQPAWASFDYPEELPDERLRLIFTCCHPELEEKTRVALTLRTVCGLTTREIAEVFLDT
jgi:RNA polymerase sigma factor (sigma-70 family)